MPIANSRMRDCKPVKTKKKVTELEARVTGLTKKTDALETQVQEKDVSIGRKDVSMNRMREEKQNMAKDMQKVIVGWDRALKDIVQITTSGTSDLEKGSCEKDFIELLNAGIQTDKGQAAATRVDFMLFSTLGHTFSR